VRIDWWDPDQLPFTIMIILGVVGFLLSEGGYRLGWWNDFHAWGDILTFVLAVVGAAATFLLGATRGQVQGVRSEVRPVGHGVQQVGHDIRHVRQVGEGIGQVRQEVRAAHDDIVARQDRQTEVLTQIRDRLPPGPHPQP
jgi:hypothetical protein